MTDKADSWQIAEVADFIYRNGHTIVTAQFPDDLLHESASICNKIKSACEEKGHAINVRVLSTRLNSLTSSLLLFNVGPLVLLSNAHAFLLDLYPRRYNI